jgi:glycosyltransferase involved in cell wall biosynthesis
MPPLVSVMMPCFNAERTLPWALASLVSQTYRDWECLFVDDGSTDRSFEVVEALGDSRIRPIRMGQNMGRGVARQAALDQASGELLCMLDADDWIYPTKIEHQVDAMLREPHLALVSTGFAIADSQGKLAGIRATGPEGPLRILGPLTGVSAPWLPFAASMLRTDLARAVRFHAGLRACEDLAFLIGLLQGRRYAILPEASYVYNEYDSMTLEKMVLALRMSRRVFRMFRESAPIQSRWNEGRVLVKEVVYRAGFAFGFSEHLLRRRSRPPTARDIDAFLTARRVVEDGYARLFPARGGAGVVPTPRCSAPRTYDEGARQ